VADDEDLSPLTLMRHDHPLGYSYSLMLTAEDMVPVMDTFEEYDYYGNGYGWEGVARSAVRAHAPNLTDLLDYDPEGDTFVAVSNDPDALRRLGALLRRALREPDFLEQLLRDGDPDWFD
jgi:Immunity protein 51